MATGDYWDEGLRYADVGCYLDESATGGYATNYYDDLKWIPYPYEEKPKTVAPEIDIPEELL